jgi:hypothetical protein
MSKPSSADAEQAPDNLSNPQSNPRSAIASLFQIQFLDFLLDIEALRLLRCCTNYYICHFQVQTEKILFHRKSKTLFL